MLKRNLCFILILGGLLINTTVSNAQVTGGAINGNVTDANSAVIPNATVKLESKTRGQVLTAQTTSTGSYLFPNVPVGTYTLSVEQTGFSKTTKELIVALNQTTTVDITLQAAGGTSVVDVTTASDTIIQTDSSQLGKSFDNRKVLDLPNFGNPNNLALLAPNVVTRAEGTQGSGGTVGGVRPRGNTFNIDGVDNNDASVTGPSTGVIQDAVEEFTLLQNNFNAEFGAGAGGQFNTITKSGTNSFHGSAFTYIDSQRFNARQTLEDGVTKSLFKQARYGGTGGGPIVKDKLFFFGAYQRNYFTGAGTSGSYLAPTAAGLNQIAAIPGVSPFVINLLRNNLTLAPVADAQSTADAGPVLGISGIPFGQVILPIPNSLEGHSFQINIDHTPNAANQFRYRFGYDRQRAIEPGGGGLKFNNFLAFDSRLFSANWVRTINANLINDLRLSYRTATDNRPLVDESVTDFPNITVDSLALALGPNSNLPQGTPVDNNYQIYDSMTLIHGNHTFKFGGEMRRLIFTSSFLPRARGDYDYSTLDILLRDLKPDVTDKRGVGSPNFVGNRFQWFFFGQDDWKVRSNLTLNLGLRYEFSNLPRDAASQALNSVANVPGVIEFNVPKTDKNNFAPRVGFAWSPNFENNSVGRFLFGSQGQSSIRANFAVSHFVNFQNILLLNLPPQFSQEANNVGSNSAFLQNGGIPNVILPTSTPAQARAATSSYIVDQVTPYSLSWAISYQRQITANTAIEFRFLSTRVRKLPLQVQFNAATTSAADQVLPTFYSQPTAAQLAGLPTLLDIASRDTVGVPALSQYGFAGLVTAFPNVGKSWYDGGSVSLNRRFTNNFGMTAAYTFSKTLDNGTNELNSSALNPRRAQNGFNIDDEKGLSALDIPHRFVISFNYDVPFFKNDSNKLLKAILGGWQMNGIFQAQSGQPITIRSGIDSNINLDAPGDRALLNVNGRRGTSSGVCPVDRFGRFLQPNEDFFGPGIPTTDISKCSLGAYGPTNAVAYLVIDPNAQYIQRGFLAAGTTAGRNTFRTKGFNQTDMVLLKNTRFGRDGRFNFQIGAEIFDLFNQRSQTIGTPSLTLGVSGVSAQNAAFGIAGNPNFNDYSIGNYSGRTITMRAKFIF